MKQDKRKNLQVEIDSGYLYQVLSELEEDENLSRIYRELSGVESQHAQHYIDNMVKEGKKAPALNPSGRAKTLAWLARRFGAQMILPVLSDMEKGLSMSTLRAKKKYGQPISGNEYAHAKILDSIQEHSDKGMEGGQISKLEGRHRSVGGNNLRAAILGANDGLVSNLSLVMGVAGAATTNQNILVAGFAGLLAGAISMALGEWLSVQGSKEQYEKQIAIEKEELEEHPEEEAKELSLIYQTKGITQERADKLAQDMIQNKETALDTLVREELGVDPDELGGSPWEAAFASFFLFALGAIIPVFPYLFLQGWQAVLLSLGVSTLGLFGIGAAITLFTGRSVWMSGSRQILFGLVASGITYGIGHLVGISLAG